MATSFVAGRTAQSTLVRFEADIDSRIGEMLCRILRRWPDRVTRATHGTWYDGFSVEIIVPDARVATDDVPVLLRAAAHHAADNVQALLADATRAFALT